MTSSDGDSDSSSVRFNLRPRALRRRCYVHSGGGGGGVDRGGGDGDAGGVVARQKSRPPPLSKYRRKTANARERFRMQEINDAFERLRKAVPGLSAANPSADGSLVFGRVDAKFTGRGQHLTKITTLRLAMDYIDALSQLLADADQLGAACCWSAGVNGVGNSTLREPPAASVAPQTTAAMQAFSLSLQQTALLQSQAHQHNQQQQQQHPQTSARSGENALSLDELYGDIQELIASDGTDLGSDLYSEDSI